MKLSSIHINPSNPRIIKDDRFKKLVKSIEEFPKMMELRPIIIDSEGMILGGNMRFKALKELGYKDIPDNWVKQAETLTEAEKRRFIIEDNLPFGEWDWDTLANEWNEQELIDWGMDIPDFAFKQEAQEDDYEISDEIETDIILGDLFEIGQHRLLCGDSTKKEDVEKLMDGQKADFVFTDPPYGVEIGAKNRFLNSFQKAGRNLKDIKDDNISKDDLYTKLVSAFTNLRNVSNDCCSYFVTAPQGGELGLMMMMMMMESGLKVRHVLMWYKNAPTFSMGRLDYEYQHEPILLTWNKKHKFYGGGAI